jgi:tRNA threonylcarbamoyladenosine biosynthesis protein TsaB
MNHHILCIETSTKACSVALARNGELLALKESVDQDYSHAEQLNLFIEEVMKQGKIEFSNLDAISVSKGPGSFTGLRIGVSTAKGIAYALNIPLISVETLESMAVGFLQSFVEDSDGLLVPMIDARRKEVYLRIYDSELNPKTETGAEVINEDSFNKWKDYKKIHLFGDGADKFDEDFKGNNQVLVHRDFYPSAKFMTGISNQKFKNKKFEDVAYFEPFYLKEFIAIKPRKLF